jgi:hypothetical protein
MVSASDRSRCRRERVADVLAEFLAGLVETDDRSSLVVRFLIQRQERFHPVDKLCVLCGRNEPILRAVWLQVVFLAAV